ncbi:hypothetical protein [Streptomyces johnsoniae]|uniref:Secreted protein n=1 Tax=Streptomyces johnsoniae TaxID=3075532 RepID=A0ABU2S3P7_9ACTN|nr:hypothetical protein [Streptomyces sp. DSM 41886]MDT0443044.1 hypothetical protein [Streptomyces sp. DSM 41886]
MARRSALRAGVLSLAAISMALSAPASGQARESTEGSVGVQAIYEDDQCTMTTACMAIFYNSRGNDGVFDSPCFITNKNLYSHNGHTIQHGTTTFDVLYQFSHGRIWDDTGWSGANGHKCGGPATGSGYSLKNDAAGAVNADSRHHRIYYNTGYQGTSQTIEGSENLVPALKNDNASSRRL